MSETATQWAFVANELSKVAEGLTKDGDKYQAAERLISLLRRCVSLADRTIAAFSKDDVAGTPPEARLQRSDVNDRGDVQRGDFKFVEIRHFYVHLFRQTIELDDEAEYKRLLVAPDAELVELFEGEFGLPVALLKEHDENRGHVRCSALTHAGHRCKNFIPGFHDLNDVLRWAERQGDYCHIHSDRTTNAKSVGARGEGQ